MGKLKDVLLDPEKRPAVINDCCALVEGEVARKKGVSGLAIKGGYKVVKAMRPRMIPETVDFLLDDFVENMEPIVEAHDGSGPVGKYLESRKKDVAGALLAITDKKAERSRNKAVKKVYYKLRPMGEKNVMEGVPAVGRLVEKYLK